jgi:hypothetical protein
VAPFGGFFASGFKRAFKIKDFGDAIPGHGGFTDRCSDCFNRAIAITICWILRTHISPLIIVVDSIDGPCFKCNYFIHQRKGLATPWRFVSTHAFLLDFYRKVVGCYFIIINNALPISFKAKNPVS